MRTTIAILALASVLSVAGAQQQAPKAPPATPQAPKAPPATPQAMPTVVAPQELGLTKEEELEISNYQLKKQVLDQRVQSAEDSLLNEYMSRVSDILAKHHLTNIVIDRQSFNLLRVPAKQPTAPAAAAPATKASPPAK